MIRKKSQTRKKTQKLTALYNVSPRKRRINLALRGEVLAIYEFGDSHEQSYARVCVCVFERVNYDGKLLLQNACDFADHLRAPSVNGNWEGSNNE